MTGTKTGIGKQRGLIVQPRDLDILRELAVMRVADREQVKVAAGFGSTTRVSTRLLALTCGGLLRRFFLGSGGGRNLHQDKLKPRQLEALAFYLGAHGVDPAPVLEQILRVR